MEQSDDLEVALTNKEISSSIRKALVDIDTELRGLTLDHPRTKTSCHVSEIRELLRTISSLTHYIHEANHER